MAKKLKYGKIAIVIFLTALIWIWADLALDETLPDKPAVVVVEESADPKLWVSFNRAFSADIRITLSGPQTAIANENRRLKDGKIRRFVLDVVQERINRPGNYNLRLLPFLQKDKQIRQVGLKVESCEPEVLDVNVVELVKKSLAVECLDENGASLRAESIEPSKVDMFVPEDRRIARVRLTRKEIEQARVTAIEMRPYVELAEDQVRYAAEPVRIKMPPQADPRSEVTIRAPRLGIALSPILQGRYKVDVKNLNEVIGPISIRATPEAKQAYEAMRYQVILEIDDEDVKAEVRRELVYNFPEEFVGRDEIVLNQRRLEARFTLSPLSIEAQ